MIGKALFEGTVDFIGHRNKSLTFDETRHSRIGTNVATMYRNCSTHADSSFYPQRSGKYIDTQRAIRLIQQNSSGHVMK